MKTNLKLLCGILLAATLFTSCDKETETSIVGTWTVASDQLFRENGTALITYDLEAQKITYHNDFGEPIETEDFPFSMTFTLTEDGNFTATVETMGEEGTMDEEGTAEELSGTYKVYTEDGQQYISITAKDEESGDTDVIEEHTDVMQITTFSENLLVLEYTDTDEDLEGNPYNYKHIITLKRK